MPYTIALQSPESPVKEEWEWTTDRLTAYAGDEDNIPLNRYPKRTFGGVFEFDAEADIRRHMALMFQRHRSALKLPLYQYQAKLKAPATAGDVGVSVNATRSDLREGLLAILVEGSKYEELTVDTIAADAVTFTTPLVHSYSSRALLCPLTIVYSATGAGFTRRNPDDSASASFRYMESEPWAPLISPLNAEALTMFDGKAVLEARPIGTQFDAGLDTGIRIVDYIGLADVFSPWTQSQWGFTLTWQVNRVIDNASWLWWQVFADHIQGASIPFLLPSHRADLAIVTPVAGGGNQVTLLGTEYSQHYQSSDTFKRVVVNSDAGRHYALVTAVAQVGGNDRLTLSPALPAGAGWATNQSLEFLLKVRNADDKIVLNHYDFHTEVSMNLRTVG